MPDLRLIRDNLLLYPVRCNEVFYRIGLDAWAPIMLCGSKRVSDLDGFRPCYHPLHKAIVDRFLNQQPRRTRVHTSPDWRQTSRPSMHLSRNSSSVHYTLKNNWVLIQGWPERYFLMHIPWSIVRWSSPPVKATLLTRELEARRLSA